MQDAVPAWLHESPMRGRILRRTGHKTTAHWESPWLADRLRWGLRAKAVEWDLRYCWLWPRSVSARLYSTQTRI